MKDMKCIRATKISKAKQRGIPDGPTNNNLYENVCNER